MLVDWVSLAMTEQELDALEKDLLAWERDFAGEEKIYERFLAKRRQTLEVFKMRMGKCDRSFVVGDMVQEGGQ